MKKRISLFFVLLLHFVPLSLSAQSFKADTSKSYNAPSLSSTIDGRLYMTWIEKDADQMNSFCFSFADPSTGEFNAKKVIIRGYGVSSSRLMPAKLLVKRDGTLVAVLRYNPNAKPGGGRGGFLAYTISTDAGNTWTKPLAVDNDPDPGLRGFHDATVLANDEIAVAYLKDVKNSKKREERDLRLAITKNGVFQDEKLVDAIVCDCCNISLLVDNGGDLNIYYRDNNGDVRDIGHVFSKDNGITFSDSKILYPDNWSIQGCPHNGSVSASMGDQNLITWYSAGDNEPGIRLVKENGEKLLILTESSAQNSRIVAEKDKAVFFWQEMNEKVNKPMIVYTVIKDNEISEKRWIESQGQAVNASGFVLNGEFIVVYENDKNGIEMKSVSL